MHDVELWCLATHPQNQRRETAVVADLLDTNVEATGVLSGTSTAENGVTNLRRVTRERSYGGLGSATEGFCDMENLHSAASRKAETICSR